MNILHIESPGYPWFSFEWHGDHRVYVLRKPREGYSGSTIATQIAEEVHTPEGAKAIVGAFLLGYNAHVEEPLLFKGNGPKHYFMECDPGRVGAQVGGL